MTVLGPFARAGVWVQGCPFRCDGCITKESLDFADGFEKTVDAVAAWILDVATARDATLEGITFSGGEPFAQPDACADIVEIVRRDLDLGVVCYSGFTLEELQAKRTDGVRGLLALVDLLIDGRYERELHADLLWRGSSNQRLIHLTDRYRAEVERIIGERGDRSAGLEIRLDAQGRLDITGVPPTPDFRVRIESCRDGQLDNRR